MAVSLLLAALAALALVGINEAGYRQSSRALADINEAQQVRGTLNQILQNMLDAETGQRGYLLTHKDSYLLPYQRALDRLPKMMKGLDDLPLSDPALEQRARRAHELIDLKFIELAETIQLHREGHADAAMAIVLSDVGQSHT